MHIHTYSCNACQWRLASDWDGGMFAIDSKGEEELCLHPGEDAHAAEVLGISIGEFRTGLLGDQALNGMETVQERGRVIALAELVRQRVVFRGPLRCLACDKLNELDVSRDGRVCRHCGSLDLLSPMEALGHACPRCSVGEIVAIDTGFVT